MLVAETCGTAVGGWVCEVADLETAAYLPAYRRLLLIGHGKRRSVGSSCSITIACHRRKGGGWSAEALLFMRAATHTREGGTNTGSQGQRTSVGGCCDIS